MGQFLSCEKPEGSPILCRILILIPILVTALCLVNMINLRFLVQSYELWKHINTTTFGKALLSEPWRRIYLGIIQLSYTMSYTIGFLDYEFKKKYQKY